MIRLDTHNYRIEEHHNTPCRFALDRKERDKEGRVCLNNLAWFNCYEHAASAMAADAISRLNRHTIRVTFADGNTITTEINGSEDEIRRHYLGADALFQFGDTDECPTDNLQAATKIEFLS